MTDYLLFIDTEASGLPKKWDLPYSAKNNWPYSVQISWIIYTKEGQQVKQENHFIKENDVKISVSAIRIHGITQSFLQQSGESRASVMKILSDDVNAYHPLVIGHFMEFDYHMMQADFYRLAIENPVKKEMLFCTMLATTGFAKAPNQKYLKLGELYETLFLTELKNQHNAIVDAQATAECFFELVKRGQINDEIIQRQQKEIDKPYRKNDGYGCAIPMIFFILLFLLIFYHL